jgi:tRNA-Thr(GGU) m(6)t(6)A37 methyltransferase TsaA
VEVFEAYEAGLADLEGFSHLFLIYHLHRAGLPALTVVPFMDDRARGIFATRHPARPNALGLSLVRLVGRAGRWLEVEDLDVLDGTPLLDLKPYYPAFDAPEGEVRAGWLEGVPEAVAEVRGRRENVSKR